MGGRRSADEGRHRDGQNTREDVRPVRVAPGGANGEVQIRVAEGPAPAEVPVRADREHLRHLLRLHRTWRHEDGAPARSVREDRHPTGQGHDRRGNAEEASRPLEETRVRRLANRGPWALRTGEDGPGIVDREGRGRGRAGEREGAGGLALERGNDARLCLRRIPQVAVGFDRAGARFPGPRAERVRLDRRNETVHGRRSDAPLRGREASPETAPIGPPRRTDKSPRKSSAKNGPAHMEKINSFSRSDFQRDTYK